MFSFCVCWFNLMPLSMNFTWLCMFKNPLVGMLLNDYLCCVFLIRYLFFLLQSRPHALLEVGIHHNIFKRFCILKYLIHAIECITFLKRTHFFNCEASISVSRQKHDLPFAFFNRIMISSIIFLVLWHVLLTWWALIYNIIVSY